MCKGASSGPSGFRIWGDFTEHVSCGEHVNMFHWTMNMGTVNMFHWTFTIIAQKKQLPTMIQEEQRWRRDWWTVWNTPGIFRTFPAAAESLAIKSSSESRGVWYILSPQKEIKIRQIGRSWQSSYRTSSPNSSS